MPLISTGAAATVNSFAGRDPKSHPSIVISVTSVGGCSVRHKSACHGGFRRSFGRAGTTGTAGEGKEAAMLALIGIGVTIVVLVVGIGRPYPQSWYSRWGD
jgi:hypothetical protein